MISKNIANEKVNINRKRSESMIYHWGLRTKQIVLKNSLCTV